MTAVMRWLAVRSYPHRPAARSRRIRAVADRAFGARRARVTDVGEPVASPLWRPF